MDTFVGTLYNDDYIIFNGPSGNLLVQIDLAISFFKKVKPYKQYTIKTQNRI